ncbi:MAG: cation-translocating P-type ATPase [Deltaproteobacteria bacterium]|jgi:cation transport ATPase|nr:cation-translocating P-type ATPase [Deltaproteobacteria bacterium]
MVHDFLLRNGQSEFYEISNDVPLKPVDVKLQDRDFRSLDLAENLGAVSPDGQRIEFYVVDLSCTACVWILDRLETVSKDVAWSRVNINRSIVTVARRDGAKFADIARLIHKLGFTAEPVAAQSQYENLERRNLRRSLIRTGVLGALTGNIMLLSISLYGGADGDLGTMFRWLMGALAIPIVTWGAWPLYTNSWRAVLTKRVSLDVPISLAVISGFTAGAVGLFTGRDLLYFDSVAMLVFLLQSSRSALDFLKRKFASVDIVPNWLLQTVRNTATQEQILPDRIKSGMAISLTAGQRLPVDARSQSLSSQWDISVLTGESRPYRPAFGEALAAGSLLISETADLIAAGGVRDSRVATLLRDWREGKRERKGLSEVSDHVGQIFTIIVLTLAGLLIAIELTTGFSTGPSGWIRALTLLLAACPCVFGIGIPLAESIVMNRLAEVGLIVREPSFLQKLKRITTVFFDKTGTLTTGRMAVTSLRTYGDLSDSEALAIASGMEAEQFHPIARAICAFAKSQGIEKRSFQSTTLPLFRGGHQIGVEVRTATDIFSLESNTQVEPQISSDNQSNTVSLFVSKPRPGADLDIDFNQQLLATFSLQDELRPSVAETVRSLQSRLKLKVRILSGDQAGAVTNLLQTLKLAPDTGVSELTPKAKADYIGKHALESDSLMIGDGANDAEALKRSFASIAVKGDLSVCLESADAVLVVDSVAPVSFAFLLARKLHQTLIATLLLSASINVLAAVLAVSGTITPLIAAILMPTSGLIVTLTTWQMLRDKSISKKTKQKKRIL